MKFTIHTSTEISLSIANKIISHRDKKVLLLLPGGSFLDLIPEIFATILKSAESNVVELNFLTITVIDERYQEGKAEHQDSNFSQINAVAEAHELRQKGVTFYSVLKEGLSLEDTAREYDQFITNAIHGEGMHKIGVLGVGTDYHLAGIMPLKQEYYNKFKSNYVCGYRISEVSDSDNEHEERVTLNFNGIMKLDDVSLYAIGPNKYTILRNLVAANAPTIKEISDKPVLFLHELKKDVEIYTDQELFD